MKLFARWNHWVGALKLEVRALYLAFRDPRTPWYARLVVGMVVAYALSPIDLIPDPIPILGYLDDLILLPLGILLARYLIPRDVLDECRHRARRWRSELRTNWAGAAIVVAIWISLLTGLVILLSSLFEDSRP